MVSEKFGENGMFRMFALFFVGFMFFNPGNILAVEHKTSSPEAEEALKGYIAAEERSASHKRRDQYRHPFETLTFFGLEADMTLVEIWPGGQGSWYRGIIEPFISDGGGSYIPVTRNSDFLMNEENLPYGEVDMVLVFRAHAFIIYEKPPQKYIDALFAMLKPGGILGIVDHAGDEAIPQDPEGDNGYVNESHFLMMAKEAGFIALADTDVNRNAKDTKDHPRGVWSLPPSLRGTSAGSEERQRYLDIGESDRFTIKLYKPEE